MRGEAATMSCTCVNKLFEPGWSCYGNGSDVCGQKHRLFLYLCMCGVEGVRCGGSEVWRE